MNDKGGVGKSTTAHNLACGLIRENGSRVLIVDLDAQVANVSLLCGWRDRTDKHGTMYEALVNKTSLPVYQVKVGDIIEIAFGQRSLKVQVLAVNETAKKDEAPAMYRELE